MASAHLSAILSSVLISECSVVPGSRDLSLLRSLVAFFYKMFCFPMEVASRGRRFNLNERDGFVVGFHYFFDYVVCHNVSRIFRGAFSKFVADKEFDKFVPIFFRFNSP